MARILRPLRGLQGEQRGERWRDQERLHIGFLKHQKSRPVDDAALMKEHRFVYENTFSADKYHKYVRIPFDPKAAPGPKVPWQQ